MQGDDPVDDAGNIMYEGKDGMKTLTEFEFNTVDPGKTGTFSLRENFAQNQKPPSSPTDEGGFVFFL